jgi:hypothetical protein
VVWTERTSGGLQSGLAAAGGAERVERSARVDCGRRARGIGLGLLIALWEGLYTQRRSWALPSAFARPAGTRPSWAVTCHVSTHGLHGPLAGPSWA